MKKSETIYFFIIFFIIFVFFNYNLIAQKDSIYYKNFVKHVDGTFCNEIPPNASFTVYINNDQSRILTDESARWDTSGSPNIEGNGTFGIELVNFNNPDLNVGDSVFIRFSCNKYKQQNILKARINAIPWFTFPETLYLLEGNYPDPPQNVSISFDSLTDKITLSWEQIPGLSYIIYKRNENDTLFNGMDRKLYYLIASNITSSSFEDTEIISGEKYAYIIYAVNSDSLISSHSEEASMSTNKINNLSVVPRATTSIISWNKFSNENDTITGYNIYRREENDIYQLPTAFTGLDTIYIDSRLQPNKKYLYKIKARNNNGEEIAVSNEYGIVTLSSSAGFYKYANLKIAIIIYQNTNRGSIIDADVNKIKRSLELAKLFYWRNSKMKLNVEFTYYPIKDYKSFPDANDSWGSMIITSEDLKNLGVMNTQYDIIFRITTAVNGYWSYGVQDLPLPGPKRKTGFSHVQWPIGTGVIYPGNSPDINYGLVWVFVHEVQHAIDALYNENGFPEMYHGDVPWEFPVACGEHFDFQAKIFCTFEAYEQLQSNWGDIYESIDLDEDDFPDNDNLVVLDETRFGSSSSLKDTDSDGLMDKFEAIDGTYEGSNPNSQDTDKDEIEDGYDSFPRYPISTNIPLFTPIIDGIIEPEWHLINNSVIYSEMTFTPKIFMNYSSDSLYIALCLTKPATPELSFDFQADGWWWGTGNTMIKLNTSTGEISSLRTWDASTEVRNFQGGGGMWDDDPQYQQQFNRKVIYKENINLKFRKDEDTTWLEMAIAKNDFAGLTLNNGDQIGLNIYYSNIYGTSAVTFDQYSFVNFILGEIVDIKDEPGELISEYALFQNYPNPFNSSTIIKYQIPESGFVSIKIYDVIGRELKTLVNEYKQKGSYQIFFDSISFNKDKLASGIYFYQIKVNNFVSTKKMIILK